MDVKEQAILIRVLRERAIEYDPAEIDSTFANADSRSNPRIWVQEHLTSATLLTEEERVFGESLELSETSNVTGRILDDADLEAAVYSLEASTTAIEEQCRLMEQQKRALSKLISACSPHNIQPRTQSHAARASAQTRERLGFEVEDRTNTLHSRLKSSGQAADSAANAFASGVDRVLNRDDRLLEGLQKVLPNLLDSAEDTSLGNEVAKLCDALIALTAQDIRARVDAAYHQACSEAASSSLTNGSERDVAKQQRALIGELDELSGEIDSLASMAINSKYRQPIMRNVEHVHLDGTFAKAQWSQYIVTTLQYLTQRLVTLESHCQHLHAHQQAVQQVSRILTSHLSDPSPPQREKPLSHRNHATPATPAKGLKPLRLVEANFSEPQDPVTQLLRLLHIQVPDVEDSEKLVEALQQTLTERSARVQVLRATTENETTAQLAEAANKAEEDMQNLLSAVYAHSKYGSVKLQDEGVQASIDRLATKVDALGNGMRQLDVEAVVQKVRALQRAAFER